MKISESRLRKLIRSILVEEVGPNKKIATPVKDEDIQGGTHAFHGWDMGGSSGMRMGKRGGPDFDKAQEEEGNPKPKKVVTSGEIEHAKNWLLKYKPEKLIAYSRGSAVLHAMAQKYPEIPLPIISYVAPAAKRPQWGHESTEGPDVKGAVVASTNDPYIPVKQACSVAADGGIPLFVVDDGSSHVSILKHKGKTQIGDLPSGTVQIDPEECLASDLENWGAGSASKDDLAKQKASLEALTIEENLRRIVRSILVEKKKKAKKKREVKCPLLPNGKRDYKCEYQKYGGASEKGKKDRAARNKARKQAERMGLVKKGDGMELDHIMPLSLGGSNDQTNWQIMSRADNRRKGKKWDGKSGSKK